MHATLKTALLATALTAASVAMAQSTRPGLWNVENKMGGNPEMERAMAQMQQQLAAMPPAQRKQMEAMMGQSGVSMGAGGAMAVKVCITPEMAARQELPTQSKGECTTQLSPRSGNTVKMSFVCKNPPSSGEGTYTFDSDKAYTMQMLIRSTQQGKPHQMTMNAKGQWLAADCGTVKPITLPKQ